MYSGHKKKGIQKWGIPNIIGFTMFVNGKLARLMEKTNAQVN